MKNKTFLISTYLEIGGTVKVEAKTQKEAEKKAVAKIDELGEEAFSEIVHRDFHTC